ncbi:MAG TPA: hypothetical protein VGV93_00070 [Acidimicrobiales bacterium]|nr:hypothetical protein [Acidimicrobiales bacterium]
MRHLQVVGKGNKTRTKPIEGALEKVFKDNLDHLFGHSSTPSPPCTA